MVETALSTNPPPSSTAIDPNLAYRTLNRGAVASIALLVLSLTGFMFWQLLLLAIAGFLLAYSGYRNIRRYPEEYTGLRLATAGMILCPTVLMLGIAYHTFVYATEVPEGYTRVGFYELQPDTLGSLKLPKRAMELKRQKIFIKGYVHPGVNGMGKVDQFVLVPDMGTCCFGGQPKPTDMILVNTTPEGRVAYRQRMYALAGEFDIGDHFESVGKVNNVLYRLQAHQAK
jgi:hypothetical protein